MSDSVVKIAKITVVLSVVVKMLVSIVVVTLASVVVVAKILVSVAVVEKMTAEVKTIHIQIIIIKNGWDSNVKWPLVPFKFVC